MIHQPIGGVQGQASDIEIQANEILELKARLNAIYAHHTKKSLKQIEKDIDRVFYISASEAKKYGIIDIVLEAKEDVSILIRILLLLILIIYFLFAVAPLWV